MYEYRQRRGRKTGSDVLRTLGLIRELKAFKFEHAASALDFEGSLFLGYTVLLIIIPVVY